MLLLLCSGLVLVEGVKWISFHSGYDFGYLLKLLTCSPLPSEEQVFFDLLHTYFLCIYDIKYMMLSCDNLKGGLQKLAEDLQVRGACLCTAAGVWRARAREQSAVIRPHCGVAQSAVWRAACVTVAPVQTTRVRCTCALARARLRWRVARETWDTQW